MEHNPKWKFFFQIKLIEQFEYSNHNLTWFIWSIWNGCGMPAVNAYPSGHLVPSHHCWTWLCSNWDQIPRVCHVFTRLFTSNTPWYFLDFASEALAFLQYKCTCRVYISSIMVTQKYKNIRTLTSAHVSDGSPEYELSTISYKSKGLILKGIKRLLLYEKNRSPIDIHLLITRTKYTKLYRHFRLKILDKKNRRANWKLFWSIDMLSSFPGIFICSLLIMPGLAPRMKAT